MLNTLKKLSASNSSGAVAAHSKEAEHVIKNGLLAVAMNIVLTGMGVGIGALFPAVSAFFSGIFGFIAFMIASIALIVFIQARHKSTSGIVGFFLFGLLEGCFLSGYVLMFPLATVATALAGTALIAFLCMGVESKTNVDSENWGKYLMIGLIVAIVMMVINIFLGSSLVGALISVGVILLMCGFLVYEIKQAKKNPQDGYLLFALGFYLSIINIFIHLLSLLGMVDD